MARPFLILSLLLALFAGPRSAHATEPSFQAAPWPLGEERVYQVALRAHKPSVSRNPLYSLDAQWRWVAVERTADGTWFHTHFERAQTLRVARRADSPTGPMVFVGSDGTLDVRQPVEAFRQDPNNAPWGVLHRVMVSYLVDAMRAPPPSPSATFVFRGIGPLGKAQTEFDVSPDGRTVSRRRPKYTDPIDSDQRTRQYSFKHAWGSLALDNDGRIATARWTHEGPYTVDITLTLTATRTPQELPTLEVRGWPRVGLDGHITCELPNMISAEAWMAAVRACDEEAAWGLHLGERATGTEAIATVRSFIRSEADAQRLLDDPALAKLQGLLGAACDTLPVSFFKQAVANENWSLLSGLRNCREPDEKYRAFARDQWAYGADHSPALLSSLALVFTTTGWRDEASARVIEQTTRDALLSDPTSDQYEPLIRTLAYFTDGISNVAATLPERTVERLVRHRALLEGGGVIRWLPGPERWAPAGCETFVPALEVARGEAVWPAWQALNDCETVRDKRARLWVMYAGYQRNSTARAIEIAWRMNAYDLVVEQVNFNPRVRKSECEQSQILRDVGAWIRTRRARRYDPSEDAMTFCQHPE